MRRSFPIPFLAAPFLALALIWALFASAPAGAASAASPAQAAGGSTLATPPAATTATRTAPGHPDTAAAASPTVADLEQLVGTLQNDQARAELIKQLQGLITAQRGAAPASPPESLSGLSMQLNALSEEVLAGAAMFLNAPRLIAWSRSQFADEAKRRRWVEFALAFGVAFGLALTAEWATRRVVGRYFPRGWPQRRESRRSQFLLAALGIALEALPILAFAAAGSIAVAMTVPPFSMAQYGLSTLMQATIAARLILAVAKAVLVPPDGAPSFVPATEESRNYLLIWLRRFTCWAVFGYAGAAAAWWLGVPGSLYALMLKVIGLVVAVLGIVFVLQNRRLVAGWIKGAAPAGSVGWIRLRQRLAESWHVLAIVYIVGLYASYALRVEGGSAYILRATLVSLLIIVAARLAVRFIYTLSARGFAIAPELKERFPLIEQRANRYLPLLTGLAGLAVYVFAMLLILQVWDVASFAWFETSLGRRVTGTLFSIALVLAIALVAWELLASAIERHLAALETDGSPSRARRRTLLPLLRTVLLCVIVTISGLVILSQIGLDIAPLLAGAGVVGLAIGFGSQALVKDVITGLFILVEDTIALGDIVDVGKDHAGIVESITMRTIRLRDQSGIVHTIPFSEVTTVKNLTKDYSCAVVRINIAYGEDIDRVVEILREVCNELAADEELGPLILDPFDYRGVDRLDDFSVVLLLRVRTVPGKHLTVGRALNRLIKIAFDKHRVRTRDPSPMVVTGPATAGLGTTDAAAERAASAPEPALQRRTA